MTMCTEMICRTSHLSFPRSAMRDQRSQQKKEHQPTSSDRNVLVLLLLSLLPVMILSVLQSAIIPMVVLILSILVVSIIINVVLISL